MCCFKQFREMFLYLLDNIIYLEVINKFLPEIYTLLSDFVVANKIISVFKIHKLKKVLTLKYYAQSTLILSVNKKLRDLINV